MTLFSDKDWTLIGTLLSFTNNLAISKDTYIKEFYETLDKSNSLFFYQTISEAIGSKSSIYAGFKLDT